MAGVEKPKAEGMRIRKEGGRNDASGRLRLAI